MVLACGTEPPIWVASALSLPLRRLEEFLADKALLSGRSQSLFHRAQVSLSMEEDLKSGALFNFLRALKSISA